MNNIISVIFVVCANIGRYSDRNTVLLRGFQSKQDAADFCKGKELRLERICGMLETIEAVMGDWELSHARPIGDNDACKVWAHRYETERTRLETVLKLDAVLADAGFTAYDDVDDIRYFVREIPFGA